MSAPAAPVEVIIIGAGVIGNSIAYHVARQRRSVLVVERQELVVEPGASWASAGGVRLWEQDPAEAALAHAALARWPTLAEELEADLQYRQGGHLLVAENEVEANHLQTVVRHQHALGFVDLSLVDRQEVLSLVPGLGEQVTAGIFSPTPAMLILGSPPTPSPTPRNGMGQCTGSPPSVSPSKESPIASLEYRPGVAGASRAVVLAAGA